MAWMKITFNACYILAANPKSYKIRIPRFAKSEYDYFYVPRGCVKPFSKARAEKEKRRLHAAIFQPLRLASHPTHNMSATHPLARRKNQILAPMNINT